MQLLAKDAKGTWIPKDPKAKRAWFFMAMLAAIVWALLYAVGALGATPKQSPTGGKEYPNCPEPVMMAQVLPDAEIAEEKPFGLFCIEGAFVLSQKGSRLEFTTVGFGPAIKTLYRATYSYRLKRKQLDSKGPWKQYELFQESKSIFTRKGDNRSIFWKHTRILPERKQFFRYRLSVKLTIRAADGTKESARYNTELLPVGKPAPAV